MNKETAAALYRRLYRLFDGVTPLKTDCGVLCGAACCKGDGKTGMRLFPGEETSLPAAETPDGRFALCCGACEREARPLACRIFPFFPIPDKNGRIAVQADPRAVNLCPLARQAQAVAFDRRFLRRVKKAGVLLAKEPECLAFLRETAAEFEEIYAMRRLLTAGEETGEEET